MRIIRSDSDGGAAAALMIYDDTYRYRLAEVTSEPEVMRACGSWRDLTLAHSVPLRAHRAAPRDVQIEAL